MLPIAFSVAPRIAAAVAAQGAGAGGGSRLMTAEAAGSPFVLVLLGGEVDGLSGSTLVAE
jgi:hypothetical protein